MNKKMLLPVDIDDATMAFGAPLDMDLLLPKYEEIPDEFKMMNNKWVNLFSQWFFNGLPKGTQFIQKPGIDQVKALRHIRTIMASYAPKHEHKTAGVAYLLSCWFDDVKIQKG